jgi:hypothetical protein
MQTMLRRERRTGCASLLFHTQLVPQHQRDQDEGASA